MQKKIIRIMMGYRSRTSCRNLKILPLASQYIFLLMLFEVKSRDIFISVSEKHNSGTRQSSNFYQPTVNFSVCQKGEYCMGIKVFNNIPSYIKDISYNLRNFEVSLKHFLYSHYLYSIDKYLRYKAIVRQ
jgi:hypothetical protein